MTFYIPEFVCGVLATIIVEFIILVSYAIYYRKNYYRKNRGENHE